MQSLNLNTFAELVKYVCKRPRMYTRFGTLAEIVAFLDGYACGANVPRGFNTPFTNFLRDLSEKLNQPKSFTPWEFLLNIYGNEEKALEALPKLYREYAKELWDSYKDLPEDWRF